MKKKILSAILALVSAGCLAFGLSACSSDNGGSNTGDKWGSVFTYETAYAEASSLGYSGTLEEFIASISGKDGENGKDGANGKDGVGIANIKIISDNLVISLSNGTILELGNIKGAQGEKGDTGATGADGKDGLTPFIGENGNWWIGETDTGVKAQGDTGATGAQGEKGDKGDTGAQGEKGDTGATGADGKDGLTPFIGENGNWWIGETDTGIKAQGEQGEKGDKGDTGATGSQGEKGDDGLSAYEIYKKYHPDYTGDEVTWIESLKGDKGESISDVKFNEKDELIITFTDGQSVNLGAVLGCLHSYSDWETGFAANCVSVGYDVRTCTKCGHIEYKFASPTGHAEGEWVIVKEATCTEPGLKQKTCSDCGTVLQEALPELGHDLVHHEAKEPTTTEVGWEAYDECSRCDFTTYVEIPVIVADQTFIVPVTTVNIVRDYGFSKDPTLNNTWNMHSGIDYSGEVGTEVYASEAGTIESIENDPIDGYIITIAHENGVKTVYKYIDLGDFTVGNTVAQGDVIGTIAAASGLESAEGAHLHFEITVNGENVNPNDYFVSE